MRKFIFGQKFLLSISSIFLLSCGDSGPLKIEENPPYTPQGLILEKILNDLTVATPGSFKVKLNTNPGKNIQITPILTKVSENSSISPSSVILGENDWNTGKSFTISGECDDSPSNATFTISLGTNNNYADNITGYDATYEDGIDTNLEINKTTYVINGEITESADVKIDYQQGYTTESGGSFQINAQLCTAPSNNVTVTASISKNPDEATVTPTSYIFNSSNWNIEQPFTITGVDDSATDGNISFTVSIGADDYLSTDKTFDFINYDNETPSIIIPANLVLSTSENGTTDTFTVKLSQQPAADVNVGIKVTDVDGVTTSKEATANTSNLLFTSSNYNTAQTVTITGEDDSDNDSDVNYYVVVGGENSANPVGYQNLPAQIIIGTNADND